MLHLYDAPEVHDGKEILAARHAPPDLRPAKAVGHAEQEVPPLQKLACKRALPEIARELAASSGRCARVV